MRKLVFDIETDGIKPSKIHCIVTICIETNEVYTYRSDKSNLQGFIDLLNKESFELIGHNIIGYDIPVLERLMAIDFSKHKVTDTLVLSRLANPQREGGHSLRNLSKDSNEQKTSHSDWSEVSDEMVEYCIQDVKTNVHVYQRLLRELKGFKDHCINLEHEVQTIVQKQVRNGWLLDVGHAMGLLGELKERKLSLEDEVHTKFKPKLKLVREIIPRVKRNGELSTVGLKFLGDQWTNVAGLFSRVDWVEFNLGSRRQIGEYLIDFGWKPTQFTENGQPVVDEKVLRGITDIPEALLIAQYLLVQKRIAQVNSWLEAIDDNTHRVHGYVNTNGAVTGRMTHNSPNLAQVPAVYSEYGKECRECFIVKKGYKLVGCDASGLELRMLAHYMNDDKYTNEILTGDIHTANQNAAGLDTRDQAKTFIYAFLYGAGDEKIGSIVGGSKKQGKELKAKFLSNTPSLSNLRDKVSSACNRGYLVGLDGRKLFIRSEHSALNTLLQSAGAVVMKKALVLLDSYATEQKLDYNFVGNIHDEFQVEVKEEHAEQFGKLAVKAIQTAGDVLALRCPLDGEYKIGNNWADTH